MLTQNYNWFEFGVNKFSGFDARAGSWNTWDFTDGIKFFNSSFLNVTVLSSEYPRTEMST